MWEIFPRVLSFCYFLLCFVIDKNLHMYRMYLWIWIDISVLIELKFVVFNVEQAICFPEKTHKCQVMRLFQFQSSGSKRGVDMEWPAGDCLPSNEVVKIAAYACP